MGRECGDRSDDAQRRAAMPRAYRDADSNAGSVSARTFVLEVDGEEFAVREVVDRATGHSDTGYDWLSGPHEGYGFGTGGPPAPSMEEHREHIRQFLAMVDPDTGYVAD